MLFITRCDYIAAARSLSLSLIINFLGDNTPFEHLPSSCFISRYATKIKRLSYIRSSDSSRNIMKLTSNHTNMMCV